MIAGVGKAARTGKRARAQVKRSPASQVKRSPASQVKRSPASKMMVGAGIAGFAALAVREFPALRREIKIWLM